jgi:hypothetical protein
MAENATASLEASQDKQLMVLGGHLMTLSDQLWKYITDGVRLKAPPLHSGISHQV